MPPSRTARDIQGLRAQAYHQKTQAPQPTRVGPVRLTGVGGFFMLDEHYQPRTAAFIVTSWLNPIVLQPGGPPVELPFRHAEPATP